MPLEKLKTFLDTNNVKYIIIRHSVAYTAPEIAAMAHVPGKELAKTVIIKIKKKMAMVVLPSSHRIDFDLLKKNLKTTAIELTNEEEFGEHFADCETGAMPPFGNLYDMDVYVEKNLTEDDEIAFNACSHRELIKLAYKDFERLVKPEVFTFSYQY
jgi:Ala-tRNA(Pro) deacylase